MTCTDCGDRCDICDERMCSTFGPEPAPTCPAHQECVDCHTDNRCRECAAAYQRVPTDALIETAGEHGDLKELRERGVL